MKKKKCLLSNKIESSNKNSYLRNPTLTNREKNCRQGRFAAETRQSRGRQRRFRSQGVHNILCANRKFVIIK
jgi:hypothetical protein